MSVEPSEATSDVWTRWQGQLINGTYPLGRCLGASDHSGVFLTRSAARDPADVAIKLVPANRALAELLLPRWKRAGGLTHPHLLRLFEWGGCQLEGLPYLYTVMEYADQTLAQLLTHRSLSEDEAREMLPPVLDALVFLHSRNLVQGQLKPANILVVGDQLKLASDTIRRVTDVTMSANPPTIHDPPEARQGGGSSPAGDIWALGVSLFEAFMRLAPSGPGEHGEAVALPADFSPAFRDVVTRCLSRNPQDRPSLAELATWALEQSAGSSPAATIQPATVAPPEPGLSEPGRSEPSAAEPETREPAPHKTPSAEGAHEGPRPASFLAQPLKSAVLTVVLGAVVIALIWTGVSRFSAHLAPAPPPVQASGASVSPTPGAAVPATTEPGPSVPAGSTAKPGRSEAGASSVALHEEIPDVPPNARRTVHGHIKVWVRVMVDQDGSVYAAVPDRAGSSRYFERLALEAAKKWTFPTSDTPSRRIMQIHFDFSREGTTARAVPLH